MTNASASASRRAWFRSPAFVLPAALAVVVALPMSVTHFAEADPAADTATQVPGNPAESPAAPDQSPNPAAENLPPGPPQPGGPATTQKQNTNNDLSSGLSSAFGSSSPFNYLEEGDVPVRTPIKTDYPKIDGLPDGVSVVRQEWLSSHRVALFLQSKVMPAEPIQVQLLLARDWYSHPNQTFPTLWMLDGLRATDEDSGWTLHTNIAQFMADKNVTVVLPVGGTASFYTDWDKPDNGKHYMWESFLTNELPAVLAKGYRANDDRAIVGLSMGGTAAVNLAEHRPDLFNFVGSFSGYLDTTSAGMATAIDRAVNEEGFHAENMWGPAGSQRWIDNDPKLGIEALRGKTVYVSAGSGRDDFGTPGSVADAQANEAGKMLEVLSRMTSETFARRADAIPDVHLVTQFRPSGVHAWPYWQFEITQAWPYIADSLGLAKADRASDCEPQGAIGELTASGLWGACINNEYDVPGGKAQDFRGGQAFWSAETGAHVLIGRIGARYNELGGPASWLGFPTTGELATPDGVGRYVHFTGGSIYWTPTTGAWEVPKDMFDAWGTKGYETGVLGYPVAEPKLLEGAWIQQFQGGYVIRRADDKVFVSQGLIARKYGEMKATASKLGAPTSNEIAIGGGAVQHFEHGHIYWSPVTGAHAVFDGAIFDHWGTTGFEKGDFGWPTSDLEPIPAGGLKQTFEHGVISQVNGKIVEQRRR
ncbi:alpha/beta hydrolase-fold protein [Corynebacterium choanae]|uniref:Diacylglycerol acyltransferase/mycolyltransferase Ag85A n=1 Tax=Corynebacterium choanae TaxID=1862358 RepID=A0A3G6J7Y2_9CORY|nr:alpha/beta hydrolase-fold protein [Corynebacterium choanae]AZA12550.1 Diacylglycerol acyltransferase/mycolyltransferase Ag85A precursor [Corynebacterium choanae]